MILLAKLEKAYIKWQIREEANKAMLLTSYLEFHIIEVPKAIKEYTKNPQDAVLQWMMFLDNPNKEEVTKIMEENKYIKEAKEELDAISKDEVLRRMALKAELERRDIGQIRYDAEQKGIKEGIKENTRLMVKKLYEINMSVEQIAKIVELDVSEVRDILKI